MSLEDLLEALDALMVEVFGSDWFDFRTRLFAWFAADPANPERLERLNALFQEAVRRER